jgi:hypothetical protein
MNLKRNGELSRRYALGPKDMVLITLTRLSSRERYKGYDNVFYVISKLKNDYPFIKYLLVGKL